MKLARARAAIHNRAYVLPDDIKTFAHAALSHRLILVPDLWMKQQAAEEVIDSIFESVPVPVIEEG